MPDTFLTPLLRPVSTFIIEFGVELYRKEEKSLWSIMFFLHTFTFLLVVRPSIGKV